MTTRRGINVAWMGEHDSDADSVRERTWNALVSRDDRRWWWSQNTDMDSRFSYVQFEERSKERPVLRGNTVTYYVPMNHVRAAHEMHTIPILMSEIFRSVCEKWAEKRGLPTPPAVDRRGSLPWHPPVPHRLHPQHLRDVDLGPDAPGDRQGQPVSMLTCSPSMTTTVAPV